MKEDSWKILKEQDILISLQDLEKQRFSLQKVQDRYTAIHDSKTRFVEFRNHIYGLKLVFQHAYFLKFGATNNDNKTSDYFDSILRKTNSLHWHIINPNISSIEKNLYEPENLDDEIVMRAIRARRGQSEFRKQLLELYKGKCSITECEVEPILEAAHIHPHAEETNYDVTNGLLLRADVHTLFDLKMITLNSDYTISVSGVLKGTEYENYQGKKISLPDNKLYHPVINILKEKAS